MDSKRIYLITNSLHISFFVIARSTTEALEHAYEPNEIDKHAYLHDGIYTLTTINYEPHLNYTMFRLFASNEVGRIGYYLDRKFTLRPSMGCLIKFKWMWVQPYYVQSKSEDKFYGPFANQNEAIFAYPILAKNDNLEDFLLTKRYISTWLT